MAEPTPQQVSDFIGAGLVCEHVDVEGDGRHFFATIVSAEFEGLSRVRRHQHSDRSRDGEERAQGHPVLDGEDGQLDSLRIGSEKHIASSNSNEKVKVFTLTEFLGSPVKTRSNSRSNSNAPPPDTSNNFAKKKSKR